MNVTRPPPGGLFFGTKVPIIPRANPGNFQTDLVGIGARNEARVSNAGAEAINAATRATVQGLTAGADLAQQAQDRKDAAQFLEVQTAQSAWRNQWQDPNNPKGMHSYKGADALKLHSVMLADYDATRDKLAANLSPRARQQFDKVSATFRSDVYRSINDYASGQLESYEKATRDTFAATASDDFANATLSGDQARVKLLRQQIATGIASDGVLRGRPDAETALRAKTIIGSGHALVVGRITNTDPAGAKRYLEANANEIDPDTYTQLEARIEGKLATHNAGRQAKAEKAVEWMRDAASTGIPVSGEKLIELSDTVKGTDQEQAFTEATQVMSEAQKVRRAPFAEQQRYIAGLAADLQKGSDDPKRDSTRLNTLRSALEAGRKLAKESPVLFYQNQGGDEVEPINTSGLSSGGVAESQLAGRFSILAAMRKQYGAEVSMNPWRPEEAEDLRRKFVNPETPDSAKLGILAMLAKVAPDAESYRDSLTPISAADRVSYLAGLEQYANHQTGKNGPVAPILLRGATVLRDKSAVLPTEAKFAAAFAEDVGDAYAAGSTERQDAYLRYKAAYAGLIHTVPADKRADTSELDDDLRTTAGSLATGGLIEVNGRQTIKPWGMTDEDFEDKRAGEIERVSLTTGFPPDTLQDMPLLAIPGHEGAYFLLNQGRAQTDPKSGKPVIVRLQ